MILLDLFDISLISTVKLGQKNVKCQKLFPIYLHNYKNADLCFYIKLTFWKPAIKKKLGIRKGCEVYAHL